MQCWFRRFCRSLIGALPSDFGDARCDDMVAHRLRSVAAKSCDRTPSCKTQNMQIETVRVTLENAACLNHVAVDIFDGEISSALLKAYLSTSNHALFVAIAEGMVVGQVRGIVHLQPDLPTDLYIDNLAVAPELKRRGVGARLVKALVEWGRENGCETTWVATETHNEEARGFYEAFGFRGDTIAYYFTDPAKR